VNIWTYCDAQQRLAPVVAIGEHAADEREQDDRELLQGTLRGPRLERGNWSSERTSQFCATICIHVPIAELQGDDPLDAGSLDRRKPPASGRMPRSSGVEGLVSASTDSTGSVVLAVAVSDKVVPGASCTGVVSSTFFTRCPSSPSIVSCPVVFSHKYFQIQF